MSWGQDQAEADIVVAVRRIPVIAIGDAAIVRVIDPGAALPLPAGYGRQARFTRF